jgi:glucose-6-phosphate isomerase
MIKEAGFSLVQRPSWQALSAHYRRIRTVHLREFFSTDLRRGERFACEAAGLYFDYAKHRITDETLRLLRELAQECALHEHIEAMFQGKPINYTEERAALHTALRAPSDVKVFEGERDIVSDVHLALGRMACFANSLRNGTWTGYSGKRVSNVVNIGIGGSGLGPLMAYQALQPYSTRTMRFRFISNVDGADFVEATRDLDPAETLFLISSKTFTTLETLTNAHTARQWILSQAASEQAVARHFVAISNDIAAATAFGIDRSQIFPLWDWVGGRYSLPSAVGLLVMIAVGAEHFSQLLSGFRAMDEHFRTAPFERNLPVLMGLLGIWYNNFFAAPTVAILPYSHYLASFPEYVQQLVMESNGKCVTIAGTQIEYQTGQIIWGGLGTNVQHSFCQLLHQGTKFVPCDFIGFSQALHPLQTHQDLLVANMFAQAEALAFGQTAREVEAEGTEPWLQPHRVYPGNIPSTTILARRLTPATLGALIALYEHSVFTQGVIWQINSFDQWGVHLGRVLARRIALDFANTTPSTLSHDSSTNTLILRHCRQKNDVFFPL